MPELLIREFSKPTITEIRKAKLSDYEERNIDVITQLTPANININESNTRPKTIHKF
jgi:hypothetical protein